MPNATTLTDLQYDIMRALWARDECTVLDVQAALLPNRPLAQTTVATLLARLEKRGAVAHKVDGRQFIYRALVTEPDVRRSMVAQLTDLLFDGRPTDLISHLLSTRDVANGDLTEVKRLVQEAEERQDAR